ncbi:hypothetical protein QQF64_025846, partial [Cirrhinus molitorella]
VDVILGRPWLAKHQPRINWSTGEILGWSKECQDHSIVQDTKELSEINQPA